jgi:hypothetical protein
MLFGRTLEFISITSEENSHRNKTIQNKKIKKEEERGEKEAAVAALNSRKSKSSKQ